MPPKARHQEQPLDQGQLFPVETSRTHPPIIGEVVENGVYPEDLAPTEEGADVRHFHETVHEAVVTEKETRNRRQGNQGKHSPLKRDGHYGSIRLGDYLPGFGPVKERNWEEAKTHARRLDTQRAEKAGHQPALPVERMSAADEPKPLDEVIAEVAFSRQQSIAAREERRAIANARVTDQFEKSKRKGGAFGGALKRRILATDSEQLSAMTNQHDIDLVTPHNLRVELFSTERRNLGYAGVLFTPEEYGAITISPEEVGRRLGANVLRHTKDRSATERHARRQEVVENDLHRRTQLAETTLTELNQELDQVERLRKEMRSPGYAHMSLDEMDGLMKTTETVFIKMFSAIVENRELGTERTESLTAAMNFLVAADDYPSTFKFWQQMSALASAWTKAKIQRFEPIKSRLDAEAAAHV